MVLKDQLDLKVLPEQMDQQEPTGVRDQQDRLEPWDLWVHSGPRAKRENPDPRALLDLLDRLVILGRKVKKDYLDILDHLVNVAQGDHLDQRELTENQDQVDSLVTEAPSAPEALRVTPVKRVQLAIQECPAE